MRYVIVLFDCHFQTFGTFLIIIRQHRRLDWRSMRVAWVASGMCQGFGCFCQILNPALLPACAQNTEHSFTVCCCAALAAGLRKRSWSST